MRLWTLVIVATLLTGVASIAAADEAASFDDLEIFAVDGGEPARILFAAPSALATRTLTADDLDVRVDGAPQSARLQRLSANDLEIAVVVDTTPDVGQLRDVQAALVELALTLPQGASMRLVDAEGTTSEPAPIPGPAIAAIRALPASTGDDMAAAVNRAMRLLDRSPRGRSALVVVGEDLAERVDPIDDRPLHSLSYLIDFGGGRVRGLLGPGAGGEAVSVDGTAGVLPVTDDVARDLRSLYLAEIPVPDDAARTVTFALATDDGDTRAVRFALGSDSRRPASDQADAGPAGAGQPDPAAQPEAAGGEQSAAGGEQSAGGLPDATVPAPEEWLPWLAVVAALGLMVAALALRLTRSPRRSATALPVPMPPPLPVAPRRHRSTSQPPRPQRPIAKLTPDTRQALAGAYRGLRRLALSSRDMAGTVPDYLFRLAEARASALLSGHERSLDAVLYTSLSGDGDPDSTVVHRAAAAVLTGWQHTARRQSAPPAVVEINALMHGLPAGTDGRRTQPVAPVRALDPLVEIGLDHMVLAAQPDEHAALVARAVTVVDVMRAARLARPLLALSEHLLSDVERYSAACRADPTDPADRDDWLTFFFEGVGQRSHVAVEQLSRMRRLRDRYRDTAPDTALMRLVDLLLSQPLIDAALIARRLSVSPERAENILATACDAGWLEPHPGDPELWVASEVLAVFEPPPDPAANGHRATF